MTEYSGYTSGYSGPSGPESPAQGPDTPALRPDTPGSKMFLYIPQGVGVNGSLQSFYHSRRPPSLYSPSHVLGAISTFQASRTRQSLKEGSSPLRKLRGGFGFEVPALSTVSKVF